MSILRSRAEIVDGTGTTLPIGEVIEITWPPVEPTVPYCGGICYHVTDESVDRLAERGVRYRGNSVPDPRLHRFFVCEHNGKVIE